MSYLRSRFNSFKFAAHGFVDLFVSQPNARIHAVAALVTIAAGLYLHISTTAWVAITICITLVIALEAINTALEYLTDLVSPTHHPLAKKVKDVAAAAVLIAAVGAVVVAMFIFLPLLRFNG